MLKLLKQKVKYLVLVVQLETALTAVKNKIPDISNLVKKTDYNAKILDIESKYITTADYNKFTKGFVSKSIKSEKLVDKSDIAGFIDNADLDLKIRSNNSNKS